jgi:hypothetical protein
MRNSDEGLVKAYALPRRADTPNYSRVIAVETGSTEFTADTLPIAIDLMIVKERPAKRKRSIVNHGRNLKFVEPTSYLVRKTLLGLGP